MKNIDLNNTSDLKKVQETLNKIIDKKIEESEIKSKISTVDNYSLFALKGIFENISERLWDTKEGKSLIKNYIKTIKEDKNLKNMYNIHESLKNFEYTTNPDLYLNEALTLARDYNDMKSLVKVQKIIKDALTILNLSNDELNNIMKDNIQIFNESLDYIINNPKTTKTLNEYTENLSNVKKYLNENMAEKKEKIVETSLKELMSDLENTISECENKWESDAIKEISYYDIAGKDKNALFEDYKARCLESLNEKIEKEENIEQKVRFTTMKENLEKKEINSKEINENILKLANLLNILSE